MTSSVWLSVALLSMMTLPVFVARWEERHYGEPLVLMVLAFVSFVTAPLGVLFVLQGDVAAGLPLFVASVYALGVSAALRGHRVLLPVLVFSIGLTLALGLLSV